MASNAIGGGAIDAEGFLKYLLHFHRTGYSRALNVTQRAAGANMSVDVNIDSSNFGGGLFMTTAGVPYFGYTNAAINATVATADPTNPRRDIVVAYIDLSLITTGTTNNLGAFKVKVVTGTAAASPSDPNAAAIQSSVGAGNPYIQLARVSLTAALGSITNAVITDLRTPAANAMPYLYGGSSNTVGHLVPNLADGTVVVTSGTGNVGTAMLAAASVTPAKLSFSGCTAYRSTAQSVPNSAFTQILFDAESYDTDTFHSTSSNTSRLTVPATGMYRVTYNAGFAIAAGGNERSFWLAVNGAGGLGANRYAVTSIGANLVNARSAGIELSLTAGDYVELWAYQDSAGALNTASEATSAGQMRISIQRLS